MTIHELELCIALYGKDIYSFCMHLTKDKHQADDLYQDTFLEATKKIKQIHYENNPKSYLLSIAFKLWKNHTRKFAWRHRIAPQTSNLGASESVADTRNDFFSYLEAEEEKKQLWEAIHRLPENYRIPILLYYMEELSVSEIAKVLMIPSGTVKSRLHKARKQLEKELEGYFYG